MTKQSTEFEAIRERHELCSFTVTKTEWNEREAFNAHTDRSTLITLVEAERARADKAEAELARVREALDEIAAHYNGGITGPGRQQADSMREIARKALET